MLEGKKVWEHYGKDGAWYMKKGTGIVEDRKADGLPIEKEALEYGKEIISLFINEKTNPNHYAT